MQPIQLTPEQYAEIKAEVQRRVHAEAQAQVQAIQAQQALNAQGQGGQVTSSKELSQVGNTGIVTKLILSKLSITVPNRPVKEAFHECGDLKDHQHPSGGWAADSQQESLFVPSVESSTSNGSNPTSCEED